MDQYLDRPGARLAYDSRGDAGPGSTLVVAHSLATSRAWEDEAGILDWGPVAGKGRSLVRFDTRGHGASTGEAVEDHYRWPALAEDLLALAAAVSPHRVPDGLGESTGCGVLLWAAVAAPDRFRRLVLTIPPTRGAARAQQAELYLAAARMIEVRGADAWRRVVSVASTPPILKAGGWTRPSSIAVRDELIPAVLRGAAASIFPDDEQLRRVSHPTLILTWDTDPSHPVDTAEYLAGRLANSALEVATTPEHVRGWSARVAAFLDAG